MTLRDKSIVIIGGTTGLGLSAARAFIDAGARVVVVGRNADSVEAAGQALGASAHAMTGDATESGTAQRAIDTAVERYGALDGLYHVAGGSGRRQGDGPLHELTDAGIDYTLDLNLKSLIYSNRAATRWLLEHERPGVVLNMGSVLGWSPSPHYFATHTYAATKAAIIGLTRAAAAHYAAISIRFNVIAPALVETPMAQRAANDEQIMRFIKTKQPLDGGRILQPNDLDAAAVYMMSDDARMMTGQVLTIDGGWTVSEGQTGNDT